MPIPESETRPTTRQLDDLKLLHDRLCKIEDVDTLSASDKASWQTAMEELSVAEEELRQQNDELIAMSAELEAERRRYYELFNFAPDCYLVTDAHGNIREANLAASGLLRHSASQLAGRPLRLYMHPDHRHELDLLIAQLRHGLPVRGAESIVQPPGAFPVPVSIHASPEIDACGRIVGIRWLMPDLTDLRNAQERAMQSERLAAVGHTVAALAHESRNALQRSQACLRLLALEVSDRPKALEYVERVQRAQEDLTRLFEDVRTFAAPTALDRKPCDLRDVWRAAWDDLAVARPAVARRELVEEFHTKDFTCFADRFRIGQVFRNLFDNALAAARPGTDGPDDASLRVVVRAVDSRGSGRPALRLSVEDNGPGLTVEQRQRLFDPFYTTKTGGMGLGLAIARRVIEAHGGAITATDAEDGGAAFVITIPRGERGDE